ncbi:MAG: YbjN domain-containing protein [Candidatus Krumholzibacteriota bacterium]|nr:YbjN domain-containing protein [Candidatus Krumholzibacteriota bacterium]
MTRKLFVPAMIMLVLMFAVGAVAALATEPDTTVIETIDGEALKDILQGEGFTNIEIDEDGDIVMRMEGSKILFLIAKDKAAIQFSYAVAGTNADMQKVNQWNVSKRFSRAFLDDENDPHLELDIDLAGGVTIARVRDFIRTCRISLVTFRVEVCY